MKNVKTNLKYDVPFTMIDRALLLSEELNIYQKMIYSILCVYASNSDKSCYPSYSTIAKKAGCSRKKAITTISELIELGFITKQTQLNSRGEHISNIYNIHTYPQKSVDNVENDGVQATLPCELDTPPSKQDIPPSVFSTPKLDTDNYKKVKYTEFNYQSDRTATEQNKIMEDLKEKIEYDYFENNMTDKIPLLDSILQYIFEMKTDEETRISKALLTKEQLANLLNTVDSCAIMEFLEHLKGKSTFGIKNIKAYFKTMLVEFLRHREFELASVG